MTKKIPSISDIIVPYAPQGANDRKWMLAEHQLAQCKMSAQIARDTLAEIADLPENDKEQELAQDSYEIARGMVLDILEHYTAFLSYIAGTPVPDRISQQEV